MYHVISYIDNNIKYINVVTDDEYKMLNRKCEILFSSNDIQSISDFYKKLGQQIKRNITEIEISNLFKIISNTVLIIYEVKLGAYKQITLESY